MKQQDPEATNKDIQTPAAQNLEANLLAIIENFDGLIYSIDKDLKYIALNSALKNMLKKMFGIDAKPGDNIYGFLETVDPTEVKEWRDIYAKAFTGETLNFVKEFNYAGAHSFWNFSINPISQNDEVVGLSCVARDVTDLRQARIALQTSEAKYRLMFDKNPLPSWIYDADTLQFIEVNDAAVRNYGYDREEFLSMSIKDIKLKEDIKLLIERVKSRKHISTLHRGERRHVKKDGTIIDVDIITNPLEVAGRTAIMVLAEDVTAKKKVAAALKESEERYRLVSENPLIGIGWASLDGTILHLNEAFGNMLGYTHEELSDLHFSKVTHPDDLVSEELLFAKLKTEEIDHYKIEKRYITKQGESIWAELNLSKVRNHNGYEYCIGVIQDIRQRKQAEEAILKLNEELEDKVQQRTVQLKTAYQELDAFSYSVSHDLRSPLRIINGYANILKEDLVDKIDEELKNYLGIIIDKVSHMDIMINDILNLSRLDRKALDIQQVDMHTIVTSALEELNHTNKNHPAVITIDTLPNAYCDHRMMKQVWINLIGNAIKYSSKEATPRIKISSLQINGETTYYIKDNGVGFDMKHSDKLFNAFQRLHDASDFDGTGVGLALVSRIITKHSGKIWADAKTNEGATFYFSLSSS